MARWKAAQPCLASPTASPGSDPFPTPGNQAPCRPVQEARKPTQHDCLSSSPLPLWLLSPLATRSFLRGLLKLGVQCVAIFLFLSSAHKPTLLFSIRE